MPGRLATGWLAQQALPELDPHALALAAEMMRAAAAEAGRDPDDARVVLRLVESAGRAGEIASALPALATAGVDEIIVNVDWEDEDAAGQYTRMRS